MSALAETTAAYAVSETSDVAHALVKRDRNFTLRDTHGVPACRIATAASSRRLVTVRDEHQASGVLRPVVCEDAAVESMAVLCLDARTRALAVFEVAKGGPCRMAVTAACILRPAVAIGASGVIIAHNHPSGSATPSGEDIDLTKKVAAAADVVGIPLLDHLILTADGGLYSFRQSGLISDA